jgi:glycosyltransferase involved in cell wall biosynthesis
LWIRSSLRQEAIQRLSAHVSWPDRIKAARSFVAAIRPDLVSLQYVPYSFHPAGLNFVLPQILSAIVGQLPVQIMLHEIWTGAHVGAAAKVRVFGFCQRKIIESVLKKLSCRVIHTSNLVYVRLLQKRHIPAKLLPLFGSIPIASVENTAPPNGNVLRIGMFGAIHPEWSPDAFLTQLEKLGRPLSVSHIGRIGPGESIWSDMVERFKSKIEFHLYGEQFPQQISRFLLSTDLGVATTPLSLVGKSSSVAAMLDHGLPVIVSRNDVHFPGIAEKDLASERVISVDESFLDRVKAVKRLSPEPSLPRIAKQFLDDLIAAQLGI